MGLKPMRCDILRRVCITGVALIAMSCPLAAQNENHPRLFQWEFTPLAGYRTNIISTSEPDVEGVRTRIVLKASPAIGAGFGVRYHDEDTVELRWSRQESRLHVTGPIAAASS